MTITVDEIVRRLGPRIPPSVFDPSAYPHWYAEDLIRRHPTLIPQDVGCPPPYMTRGEAREWLRRWAHAQLGATPESLAVVCADAYLRLYEVERP